jgi:hypothetical protein
VFYSGYDLEGTPDEVIALMESVKAQHPDKERVAGEQLVAHEREQYERLLKKYGKSA